MPTSAVGVIGLRDQAALHAMLLDSLDEQIAVIDRQGTIIYVNRAWTAFGIENGMGSASSGTGSNYLTVCHVSGSRGDNLAGEAAEGIRDLLNGKQTSFYFEYPCHSPTEKRWFMMRAAPLHGDAGNMFVISHHNITQRKLAEVQVEHLSLHDPLTGLANRRYFNQFLRDEWRRSLRNQFPLSFIMFDLDHFKDYNDNLGHLAGDQCLVEIAQILRMIAGRADDMAVRYGGEEFGLLLGNTSLEEAARIAEAVRQKIDQLDMRFGGTRRVTVSAGVHSMVPVEDELEASLIREADKALYLAKRRGRNQVVCA